MWLTSWRVREIICLVVSRDVSMSRAAGEVMVVREGRSEPRVQVRTSGSQRPLNAGANITCIRSHYITDL